MADTTDPLKHRYSDSEFFDLFVVSDITVNIAKANKKQDLRPVIMPHHMKTCERGFSAVVTLVRGRTAAVETKQLFE